MKARRKDDNDDFLWALINADLLGRDLDLSAWKLLAVAALSFADVPPLSGTLSKQQGDIAQRLLETCVSSVLDVSSACCKYFILMLHMLQ
jgi:hypothetical protein